MICGCKRGDTDGHRNLFGETLTYVSVSTAKDHFA